MPTCSIHPNAPFRYANVNATVTSETCVDCTDAELRAVLEACRLANGELATRELVLTIAKERDDLRAALKVAVEALGVHHVTCASHVAVAGPTYMTSPRKPCGCGVDAALASAANLGVAP